MSETSGGLDRAHLEALGLDPDVLQEHQAKIRAQLSAGRRVSFPILESGTKANGVVLELEGLDQEGLLASGKEGAEAGELCTFVPAAGAASRYLALFESIAAARRTGNAGKLAAALEELRSQVPLSELPFQVQPPRDERAEELLRYANEVRQRYGGRPKGLMPAVLEGLSFFELKLLEHRDLNPGGRLIVIVAEGKVEAFRSCLEKAPVSEELRRRVEFLVQGRKLSTLRFDAEGCPVRTEEGSYVPVVGGHGELVRLFPQVAGLGPHRSALILNIDNVLGTSERVVRNHRRLYGFHREVLGLLDAVRRACSQRELPEGLAVQMRKLCGRLGVELEAQDGPELLLAAQRDWFHTEVAEPGAGEELWRRLEALYRRPLSVLGLVPNSGSDVGGIPVFIDLDGRRVKICLEMPHANAEDQEAYFRNPERATHFNPVFALHELRADIPPEKRLDPRFWMLTKKPFQGREVYYHETVMYEAIGNSLTNNLLFVEIPRFLFHPHKVFSDCRGQSLASCGFSGVEG